MNGFTDLEYVAAFGPGQSQVADSTLVNLALIQLLRQVAEAPERKTGLPLFDDWSPQTEDACVATSGGRGHTGAPGRAGGCNPDGADEGLAQIAADPADTSLLEGAQPVPEERVDGLPCLVLADPDDTGTFQVIDQGGVFVAPGVGGLVDAEGSSARGCGAQYADAR